MSPSPRPRARPQVWIAPRQDAARKWPATREWIPSRPPALFRSDCLATASASVRRVIRCSASAGSLPRSPRYSACGACRIATCGRSTGGRHARQGLRDQFVVTGAVENERDLRGRLARRAAWRRVFGRFAAPGRLNFHSAFFCYQRLQSRQALEIITLSLFFPFQRERRERVCLKAGQCFMLHPACAPPRVRARGVENPARGCLNVLGARKRCPNRPTVPLL